MGSRLKVFSYGGSGCTALRHALGIPHHENDKHRKKPPRQMQGCKVGYIFANPMNAVLSFFARQKPNHDFPFLHGQNLGVGVPQRFTMAKLVDRGEDIFGLEAHFNNWLNRRRDYRVLFIRYETMCKNLDKIGEHFGRPCQIEFKPRKNDWRKLPVEIADGLNKIYRPLLDKILSLDEVSLR